MPLHHFLPAAYLGEFSSQTTMSRRNRRIIVGNKMSLKITQSTSSNFCAINNFYSLENEGNSESIDNLWAGYEKHLPKAIEKLIDESIDASTWSNVLVPFVTCLLLRGPDYNNRFEDRVNDLGANKFNTKDNTNNSRIFEIQRLIGSIVVAEWRVCTIKGIGELITNDIGYCYYKNIPDDNYGIAIPLDKFNVLQIIPKTKREVAKFIDNKWMPIIEYLDLETDNHLGLNICIADFANNFIFGSSEQLIKSNLSQKVMQMKLLNPSELGFMNAKQARINEFTWHRFISAISKTPISNSSTFFDFDFNIIAQSWLKHIIFPITPLELPNSMNLDHDTISINLD